MVQLINAGERGWLFIMRTDVPAALLGARRLNRQGTIIHYSEELIWKFFQGLNEREKQLQDNCNRLTLVLPTDLKRWFSKPRATFSAKTEAARFRTPPEPELEKMWRDFESTWTALGSLRFFDPNSDFTHALVTRVANQLGIESGRHPFLNTLPNAWIGFSQRTFKELLGYRRPSQQTANEVLVELATRLLDEDTDLFQWLGTGDIRIVRVSSAEPNPRFMGWRIWNSERARRYVVHAALALVNSKLVDSKPAVKTSAAGGPLGD